MLLLYSWQKWGHGIGVMMAGQRQLRGDMTMKAVFFGELLMRLATKRYEQRRPLTIADIFYCNWTEPNVFSGKPYTIFGVQETGKPNK